MLERINLNKNRDKESSKEEKKRLSQRLSELQRKINALGIPVLLVFEGWDVSGKGTLMNEILMFLDPRTFRVHNFKEGSYEENNRPFLWRYWVKTPEYGQITIFNRSYYSDLLYGEFLKQKDYQNRIKQINEFERTLTKDGTIIFKFFIHISKEEQKKRFEKLGKDVATAWRVTPRDKDENQHYDELLVKIDRELELTNKESAPWTIVEGHHKRFGTLKILNTLVKRLEKVVEAAEKTPKREMIPLIHQREATYHSQILDQIKLNQKITPLDYKNELKACQKKLRFLEHELYYYKIPLIIAFEGWDAAGKGGCIKRLTENLDPRGYTVYPTAKPSDIEKKHHYLWRFWKDIPKKGHLAIWDRSWYGRVMVEPIEGFCTEREFARSYDEIKEFEKQLSDWGAIVIKFWLQIDNEEQLKRFTERENNPEKQWKITEEDWRNREKWDSYKIAVDDMLLKTSTEDAPWVIIESQNKQYARIKVLKTVIGAIESKIKAKKCENEKNKK
ncbi:MAG: polyphosphate:AMP phosphotransferase [Eubacteriaceae bacterium]